MAPLARSISVMVQPGEAPGAQGTFAEVLAQHMIGLRLEAGQRLALPGWPRMTVEEVDPPGSVVRGGTEVEISVPPSPGDGPVNLAILVDASLTMGRGTAPTPYDRAATVIDAFLMNGRFFLGSAGLVVQGGETRHVRSMGSPETMSGALIHQVEPKGTFALPGGLERALDVLEAAGEGPRAILLVTDGQVALADPLGLALRIAEAGTRLFAVAGSPDEAIQEICRHTGGQASQKPEPVFEALAALAGARADWSPPGDPQRVEPGERAFETVIETIEEPP